ncbi:hypothetical protein HETIRDRAFT_322083 [Heterobasidion irregulare TC 32-1]|uniref:Uncharacterized protein n=1 Tax=Heterobasidion irregulare (strain TC 32-1) TaxID=747525 RepID=W4K141_HETIT|nr:uncharacterized protein HETIRDRAFT_322083 [Heterobasidion irregulare TC 32-1]ETW79532.1 hypothetical protein HETIRDRAFT_322083 [Heterobasidion irregulare TC 32-1]
MSLMIQWMLNKSHFSTSCGESYFVFLSQSFSSIIGILLPLGSCFSCCNADVTTPRECGCSIQKVWHIAHHNSLGIKYGIFGLS